MREPILAFFISQYFPLTSHERCEGSPDDVAQHISWIWTGYGGFVLLENANFRFGCRESRCRVERSGVTKLRDHSRVMGQTYASTGW